MTGTGLFVRYNGTKHAVGYGQTFNIGDITIRAIPVNFEIYSSKFQARNSSSTDIINHRYLTSYWLTRNRLLPIVRHCAEATEKLDWPIYDVIINRSKCRVPHLP